VFAVLTGPFRGDRVLALGLLTRNQLHGSRFRRIYPGIYLPAGLPVDLAVRSQAAYLLVAHRGGVLAGHSAALLLGADCAPRYAPAEVLLPGNARTHPGLRIVRGEVAPPDVVTAGGCRVTSGVRTAWDLARRSPLVEAVVAVDALARALGFAPVELLDRRAVTPRARGARQVAEVVRLADPRAESPMETRLRVGLVRSGLPAPEVQHPVLDEHGYPLARVDLAYPAARLALEYDGATHLEPRRRAADRERDTVLAGQGWETRRFGPHDVDDGLFQTVDRIRRLLLLRAPNAYRRLDVRPVNPR
jgi:very-short-patch-repair endonuclease